MKIHVLIRVRGEYSDRVESLVRAYRDPAVADRAAARLSELAAGRQREYHAWYRSVHEQHRRELYPGDGYSIDREAARRWDAVFEEHKRPLPEMLELDPGSEAWDDWRVEAVQLEEP